MKLLGKILFTGLALFSFSVKAQEIAIDSEGESVYTQYSKEDYRVQISADKPVSISGLFFNKSWDHTTTSKFTGNDTLIFTKNHGMLVQLSMLNSEDFLLLNNLSKIRPGVGLKIGYQVSADSLHNIELMVKKFKSVRVWGVNLVANLDNFNLYDTISKTISRKLPLSFGIESNATWFFRHRKGENIANSSFRFATAVVGSIMYTWNDGDLINYQDVTKTTILPTVVALDDFAGRYGVLEMGVKSRLAFSVPLYYKRINPVLYTVAKSTDLNEPDYHVGLFFNVLSSSITKSRDFKIPSSIGVGVDWVYKNPRWSDPYLVLKGTIDLGSFK